MEDTVSFDQPLTVTAKLKHGVMLNGQSLKIEQDYETVLDEMNRTPVWVNPAAYEHALEQIQLRVTEAVLACVDDRAVRDPKFRPNASADCAKLFTRLGANLTRKTPSGTYQMDKEVLEDLAEKYPVARKILLARALITVQGQVRKFGTYVKDGKIQVIWDQFGTPMGRLTAAEPNLQNRVDEVKGCVEPEPGYAYLSIDLKAHEYRVWAALSQDQTLIRIFRSDRDLHEEMGYRLKDFLFTSDEKSLRDAGKTINHALCYRMRTSTLAGRLGIDGISAQKIADAYQSIAPEATAYMDRVLDKAQENGLISTAFGRTRYIAGLRSTDEDEVLEAKKTAWHHHNAGTAADLVKLLSSRITGVLRNQAGLKYEHVRHVMNHHDEIVLEVRDDKLGEVHSLVVAVLGLVEQGFLPFASKITTAKNWGQLKA